MGLLEQSGGGGCLEKLKIVVFVAKHNIFMWTVMFDTFTYCMNSDAVECTSWDFSCVYSEIMFIIISFFQKLIKGGLQNFSKINKQGGGGTIIRYGRVFASNK